jgi:hypothetical protein
MYCNCRRSIVRISRMGFITLSIFVAAAGIAYPSFANAQQGSSREIIAEDFTKHRQETASTGARTSRQGSSTAKSGGGSAKHNPSKHNRVYRYASSSGSRTTPTSSAASSPMEQLGLTLWRLRPAKVNDTGARMLVREQGKSSELIPERVEADTALREADRIRLTIESPREGYLYVIDRDLYADDKMGDALLIFPSHGIRGGDNQVRAGKLIDIPAQEDNPNYFIARPGRGDQVGEVLTIIVTTTPLNLKIGDQPLPVSASELAKWEKTWGSESERFEMKDGAGQTWTKEEQEAAAAKGTRQLTRDEPAPQTIYRVASKNNASFLVNVQLRYNH